MYRLDFGLYSHLKEFKGMESEPMSTPREKSPLPEAQGRVEPAMLHHTGQQAQCVLTELFWPSKGAKTGAIENYAWRMHAMKTCTMALKAIVGAFTLPMIYFTPLSTAQDFFHVFKLYSVARR